MKTDLVAFQNELLSKMVAADLNMRQMYLPIQAGGQIWAIRSQDLTRVTQVERIVRVPGATSPIIGAVSHSGAVYTLIDFNAYAGTAPVVRSNKSRILFLETDDPSLDSQVAVLVERVLDLISDVMPESLDTRQAEPSPLSHPAAAAEVLVSKSGDRFLRLDVRCLTRVNPASPGSVTQR